jgi:heterotetrameric sarcosine oxidase delta subunit
MHTLTCPRCGRRPLDEFLFGGERRAVPDWITEPDARDFDEVWVFENPDGETTERWFHAAGCRRWLTVRRDTTRDVVLEVLP